MRFQQDKNSSASSTTSLRIAGGTGRGIRRHDFNVIHFFLGRHSWPRVVGMRPGWDRSLTGMRIMMHGGLGQGASRPAGGSSVRRLTSRKGRMTSAGHHVGRMIRARWGHVMDSSGTGCGARRSMWPLHRRRMRNLPMRRMHSLPSARTAPHPLTHSVRVSHALPRPVHNGRTAHDPRFHSHVTAWSVPSMMTLRHVGSSWSHLRHVLPMCKIGVPGGIGHLPKPTHPHFHL